MTWNPGRVQVQQQDTTGSACVTGGVPAYRGLAPPFGSSFLLMRSLGPLGLLGLLAAAWLSHRHLGNELGNRKSLFLCLGNKIHEKLKSHNLKKLCVGTSIMV